MSVTDERTEMGHLREETLPFEGFLEALARLSALKAFPTDEELKESRSGNAASYLADLKRNNEDQFQQLVRERYVPWGGEPNMALNRSVEHIVSILVHGVLSVSDAAREEDSVNFGHMSKWMEKAWATADK